MKGRGIFYICLTLLAWSSVPLFLKYFTHYIDGWTANGWRYAISAVFWGPVVAIGAYRRTLTKGLWTAALVPSLFNAVAQTCFAWAPYFIEPGLMTFLLRFQIVFVTLGAYILFPTERGLLRTRLFWWGLALIFCGSWGVLALGQDLPRGATAWGVVLGLLAGALFAGYALSVRYYMNRIHPVTAFAAISSYTAAALAAVMLAFGRDSGLAALDLTAPQFLMLIASSLIGIAFAHALYYAGIIRLGVSLSSGIILMQPIITSLASYFLFDEVLTTGQWLCGILALLGAGVLLSAQHRCGRPAEVEMAAPTVPKMT